MICAALLFLRLEFGVKQDSHHGSNKLGASPRCVDSCVEVVGVGKSSKVRNHRSLSLFSTFLQLLQR